MQRCHLETLALPERMRTRSMFSIPRSHLDSATYRALVRILSVCLDSSPDTSESHSYENPSCGADRIEVPEESVPSGNGGGGSCLVANDSLGHGIEHKEKEIVVISKDLEDDGLVDVELRERSVAVCAGLVDLAVDVHDEATSTGENPSLVDCEKTAFGLVGEGGQGNLQEQLNVSDGSKGFGEGEISGSALVISQDQMLCPSEFGSEMVLDVGLKGVGLVVSEVGQGKPQEQLNVCNGSLMVCEGENNRNAVGLLQDQMLCPSEFDSEMGVDVGSKELALVVDAVGQGKPQEQLNVCNGSLMVCEGKNSGNVASLQDQMLCPSEVDKPQEQHNVSNESPMLCEGENNGKLLVIAEDGIISLSKLDSEMIVDVSTKELSLVGELGQEKLHGQRNVSNGSAEVHESENNANNLVIFHDQISRPSQSSSETLVNAGSKDISLLGELLEMPQEQQNVSNVSAKLYEGDNNANALVTSQDQLIFPSEFACEMVLNLSSKEIGEHCDLAEEGPQEQQNVSDLSAKVHEGGNNARTLVSQDQMIYSSEFDSKTVVHEGSKELCFVDESGQEKPQERETTSNRPLQVCETEENGNALVISQEKMPCPSVADSETAAVNDCLKELTMDSHDRIMLCQPKELFLDREITVNDDWQEPTFRENQVEDYRTTNKVGVRKEIYDCSEPLMDSAILCTGLVNNEDMEEGEILNDIEIDNHSSDLVDGSEFVNHGKIEGGSNCSNCSEGDIRLSEPISKVEGTDVIDDRKDELLLSSADNGISKCQKSKEYDYGSFSGAYLPNIAPANVGFLDEGKPSNIKDDEVVIKKRRGPMTEERKAKKKKAKKRRRAQKEREQGVKRLKLQPIIKPKQVKYCEFYLKGRCQQGDMCKFSHDATPQTKSQPCRYFACDTCLKGDDCPFDHQLSNYPCHNFMSKGICIRGDKCKFSHKVPNLEVTPTTTGNSFSIPPLSVENSNLRKQVNLKNDCFAPHNTPKSSSSKSTFSIYEDMKENLVEKCFKRPVRIPSGVRFLSFGKGPLDGADKHQNTLLDESCTGMPACNQHIKDKMAADGFKNLLSVSQKPLPVVQQSSSMMPKIAVCPPPAHATTGKESKNDSFCSIPTPGGLQNELSDATKILEEFLFGGSI